MTWINPLDRLPQFPQADANHIVYGGIGGLALFAGLSQFLSLHDAARSAFTVMLLAAIIKKTVDFFKEGEPARVCVYKAVITAAWPASVLAVVEIAQRHGLTG